LWGWKISNLSRGAGDAVPAIQSDEDAVSNLLNLLAERKGKSQPCGLSFFTYLK
ncbi:unnamed protein product, partial [marine sediment metagenome]